jgi:hypothetical protein
VGTVGQQGVTRASKHNGHHVRPGAHRAIGYPQRVGILWTASSSRTKQRGIAPTCSTPSRCKALPVYNHNKQYNQYFAQNSTLTVVGYAFTTNKG